MADLIKIEGLTKFTAAVKRANADLPKAIRLAGNAAAQIVVDDARSRVPTGPAAGGHAKTSIKTKSTRSLVRVSAGGSRFPYFAWLDFGGSVGRKKSVKRPFYKKGRYIWAAFADHQAEVQKSLEDSLADIARSAGLDVT